MSTFATMAQNYWTTLVGALLAGLYYLDQLGPNFPKTRQEWLHASIGLGIAVLGFVAKSATVGSAPRLVLIGALALGGCATLQKEVVKIETDFSKATLADVDMAIAMAQVAKDAGAPYRLRCYSTLRKYVPETIAAAQPVAIKGVVSAYEKIAELDALARQGVGAVPADIHADCAVIGINAQEFLARVGLKFGGSLVPGGSLLPNLLGPILK